MLDTKWRTFAVWPHLSILFGHYQPAFQSKRFRSYMCWSISGRFKEVMHLVTYCEWKERKPFHVISFTRKETLSCTFQECSYLRFLVITFQNTHFEYDTLPYVKQDTSETVNLLLQRDRVFIHSLNTFVIFKKFHILTQKSKEDDPLPINIERNGHDAPWTLFYMNNLNIVISFLQRLCLEISKSQKPTSILPVPQFKACGVHVPFPFLVPGRST